MPINLRALMDYDFARDFVEDKIREPIFISKLNNKIESDEEFRAKTQILSTEVEELNKVIDAIKIIKAKRERGKIKPRRKFLKFLAKAASVAPAAAVAKKVEALGLQVQQRNKSAH